MNNTNVTFDATGANGIILDTEWAIKLVNGLQFLILNSYCSISNQEQKDYYNELIDLTKDLSHSSNVKILDLPKK